MDETRILAPFVVVAALCPPGVHSPASADRHTQSTVKSGGCSPPHWIWESHHRAQGVHQGRHIRNVLEEGGGGGGKSVCTKNGPTRFPNGTFRFFPRWSLWSPHRGGGGQPPCVTFRPVAVSLRGPGRSPVLPFACCAGSLLSVGRCGVSPPSFCGVRPS